MNRFLKIGSIVSLSLIIIACLVTPVSASTDAEYKDYINTYSRKEEYIIDDTVFVDYYINDSDELGDVVRLTYVNGLPVYLVETVDNRIVQKDLISEKKEVYLLPEQSGYLEDNSDYSARSNGFTYSNKVIYGTAFIGDKVIGVWSKHIATRHNTNYVEPNVSGMVFGAFVAAISVGLGAAIPMALATKMIVAAGGSIVGGVINGLYSGLRATGTVITYHMKVTEGGGPRERIFTDGIYFNGYVNGVNIIQYSGMYPQFAAMRDGAVASAIFNYFWDGIHHVKSWY